MLEVGMRLEIGNEGVVAVSFQQKDDNVSNLQILLTEYAEFIETTGERHVEHAA